MKKLNKKYITKKFEKIPLEAFHPRSMKTSSNLLVSARTRSAYIGLIIQLYNDF